MTRLPQRKQPKDKRLAFLCTEQEVQDIKMLALKAGYSSTAELIRAGLRLVEDELEKREYCGFSTYVEAK